jgi:hypothetical protein
LFFEDQNAHVRRTCLHRTGSREEAAQFVSKLGARPQICSIRNLKQRREKWHWMLVYLKGAEPSATLRTCLRQVSRDGSLYVIVYTHPDDDHQTSNFGEPQPAAIGTVALRPIDI